MSGDAMVASADIAAYKGEDHGIGVIVMPDMPTKLLLGGVGGRGVRE